MLGGARRRTLGGAHSAGAHSAGTHSAGTHSAGAHLAGLWACTTGRPCWASEPRALDGGTRLAVPCRFPTVGEVRTVCVCAEGRQAMLQTLSRSPAGQGCPVRAQPGVEAQHSSTGDGTRMPPDRADSAPAPGPSTGTAWCAQQALVTLRVLPGPGQRPSAQESLGEWGEGRGAREVGVGVVGGAGSTVQPGGNCPGAQGRGQVTVLTGLPSFSECHLVLTPTHS